MSTYNNPLDIQIYTTDDGSEKLVWSKGLHPIDRFVEAAKNASLDLAGQQIDPQKVQYGYGRFEWRGNDRYLIPYKTGTGSQNLFPMTFFTYGVKHD